MAALEPASKTYSWDDKVTVVDGPTPKSSAEADGSSKPLAKGASEDAGAKSDESESLAPVSIVSWADISQDLPKRPPALIGGDTDGVLRAGHIMELTGGSKTGKSWLAIELACALARGASWLGIPCKQGRVLYLNFEIGHASLADRVSKVWCVQTLKAQDKEQGKGNLDIINMRGDARLAAGLETLCAAIGEAVAIKAAEADAELYGYYSLIIFDPFYMCFNGDENSAGDVKNALRNFINLAEAMGAAVLYVHHHAKGASGGKASIDRGAGSGVHGRLPDAIVDVSTLALDEAAKTDMATRYGPDAQALRASFTLREFRQHAPIDIVYSYPVHYVADSRLNLSAYDERGADVAGEKNRERSEHAWAKRNKLIGQALESCKGEPTISAIYEKVAEPLKVASQNSFSRWLSDARCEYTKEGGGNKWLVVRRE